MNAAEWIALFGIAAGVIGTLAGTVLGERLAATAQQRAIEHADRTRFHEQRLNAYAAYQSAANRVASAILVGRLDEAATKAAVDEANVVRLVASEGTLPVFVAAHQSLLEVGTPNGELDRFNKAMAALAVAVRKELGA